MKHHPSNCLAKGMFGADCPNCSTDIPPRRQNRRKCVCCLSWNADWTWQPFGPGPTIYNFTLAGTHYRGFAALSVCDTCKAAIERGEARIFKYKNILYIEADGNVLVYKSKPEEIPKSSM